MEAAKRETTTLVIGSDKSIELRLIALIERILQEESDDPTLKVQSIIRKSIVVTVEASVAGINRLKELYRSGELDIILGYDVTIPDYEKSSPASASRQLSKADYLFRHYIGRLTNYLRRKFPYIDYEQIATTALFEVVNALDREPLLSEPFRVYRYAQRAADFQANIEVSRNPVQELPLDAAKDIPSSQYRPEEDVIANLSSFELLNALRTTTADSNIVDLAGMTHADARSAALASGIRSLPPIEHTILRMWMEEFSDEQIDQALRQNWLEQPYPYDVPDEFLRNLRRLRFPRRPYWPYRYWRYPYWDRFYWDRFPPEDGYRYVRYILRFIFDYLRAYVQDVLQRNNEGS